MSIQIRRVVSAVIGGVVGAGFVDQALAAKLPVPCLAGACGPATGAPVGFVSSGTATSVQSGNLLTINQSSSKAILNWQSFNVSADGKVVFNQPSKSSVALNRIFDGNPSAIFGNVSANGQIYLVNPNGFIFGKGANVSASGLIASSLGISDTVFNAGLVAPQFLASSTPVLQSADNRTTVMDNSGNPVLGPDGQPLKVQVSVQEGATISTPGGRLLLAAPSVQNAGSLNAPDGQVILAAGQQVFLAASSSSSLRGLVVEVDSGGTAANQLTGSINTARGNTTLVGLAVNQDGRISATTSVTANGTVRLEAGDTVAISGGGALPYKLGSTQGGQLEMGPGSRTEVLPELDSTETAVKDQTQLVSEVDLLGQSIVVTGGSIRAPSGVVSATASASPNSGVVTDGNSQARIRLEAGASIDVSGSSAELPMSANLLAIQLRANELADDPSQRNGALRGQTVYIDARKGTPLISSAAYQSALAAVPETIAQRTTAGGKVSLQSEGDVVVQTGTTINVSGGQTTYDGGVLETSQLVGKNGRLYDISGANPLLTYTGVVNPTFTQTFNKWGVQQVVPTPGFSHYEAGYIEGDSAGTLSIAAPALVLQGSLLGHSVVGALQRSGNQPSGGTLQIGIPGGLTTSTGSANLDFLAPSLTFVNQAAPVIVADDVPLPAQPVQLPIGFMTSGGFTTTKIYSNGEVALPSGVPLQLLPGASLSVQASRIDILSDIDAPGGKIQLQNALTVDVSDSSIPRPGIDIGSGVVLDVSGQWTNDAFRLSGQSVGLDPVYINGGTIGVSASVDGGELVVGDGAAFHATGGAWLQSNGKVTGGAGGSITLQSSLHGARVAIGSDVALDAFGVAGAKGGSFSFAAPRISIGGQDGAWSGRQQIDDGSNPGDVLQIGPSLFSNYGFSSVSLTANGAVAPGAPNSDILTVQAGTTITPVTQSLALNPGYEFIGTGTSVRSFTQAITLPVANRTPANLTLAVTPQITDPSQGLPGLLDFQKGASILADPGAAISLKGSGGLMMDGTIRAPGGTVSLVTQTAIAQPDPGYIPDLLLELGSDGLIDVSGTTVQTPNTQGLLLGNVLPGGTVNLIAQRGSIATDTGSKIDISGSQGPLDVADSLSGHSHTRYEVASAGGSLTVEAPEEISLRGALSARAGVGNYGQPAAGSLTIELTREEAFFSVPADQIGEFPAGPRIIQLVSDAAGFAPSAAGSGLAVLGVSQLLSSGIDSLTLEAGGTRGQTNDSGGEILISTGASLSLARQVVLNAPVVAVDSGVTGHITANYVSIGNSLGLQSNQTATTGTGALDINAAQIDVVGSVLMQGMGALNLTSSGDIAFRSVFNGGTQFGSLTIDGSIGLAAARIYPTTATSFTISAIHGPNSGTSSTDAVTITQTNASAGSPLSVGGSLTVNADQITSSGSIFAPFGSVALNASQSLHLASGSDISVSGAGLDFLYGSTQFAGTQWIYTPSGGSVATIGAIPSRAVSLSSPSLKVDAGSQINVSGGGDLFSYEWVPGTGGTKDALGQDALTHQDVTNGLYAVLPSLRGQYAPFDPQETPASGLVTGQSIYLSGINGLPAGIYPLLPARDALIQGAFLIQVQPGFNNIVPGEAASLADNTPVIAGYLTFGTTGLHSGNYQGVAVWPGTYGQSLAQYQITQASSYFAKVASAAGLPAPDLPVDAGSLSISVLNSLDFLGSVIGNAADSTGTASRIDLSAPKLEVSGNAGGSGTSIAASVVDGWKAGQIVLGGHPSADGSSIAVSSDSVVIDGGAQISADQLLVVANSAIDVESGASILSTSATSGGKAPALQPTPPPLTLTSTNPGGAALVAVSDLNLPIVQRSGSGIGGGSISIRSGAEIASKGAISLDGPGGLAVADNSVTATGASLSLASGTIGFVGGGASADSLQIDAALNNTLGTASSVRLASQGNINVYSPVALGVTDPASAPTLGSLTLSATEIANQSGAVSSVFGAKTLTLTGSGNSGASLGGAPSPAGSLSFTADQVNIGPGVLAVNGYQSVSLTAGNAVVGRGVGGVSVEGDFSIRTPLLTSVAQSKTGLTAAGTLQLNAATSSGATPIIANNLGGEIDLSADGVQIAGSISVPAGIIDVKATHDLSLAGTASLDTSGRTVTIGGHSFGAEGGNIILSAGGNLSLAAGSALAVSGAGDTPAGNITLRSVGSADVLSALSGSAGTRGGSLNLDAGSLTEGLTSLANSLQAGGFNSSATIRAHSGDLLLASGSTLSANQVNIIADTGKVEIAGSVSTTSGDLRGSIGLFGGTGVVVDSGAAVRADSSSAGNGGGDVQLGTASGGSVSLLSGSSVSARGTSTNGSLIVRAPIAGSDVGFTADGADLGGLGQIRVEPIFTVQVGSTFGRTDLTPIESSINNAMAALAPAVTARLNPNGSLPITVEAAVDLVSSGSLTITGPLNLGYVSSSNVGWRPGGDPVDLSFRAAGGILIQSTLSDGFTTARGVGGKPPTLSLTSCNSCTSDQLRSASFRFVAGADTSSPDPSAVLFGSASDLQLATGAVIRTGTGDVNLAASGSINLGKGAQVFTAGLSGAPGFKVASNNFSFPTGGGNVRLSAGADIVGSPVQQSVTAWQVRQGSPLQEDGTQSAPTEWGVDLNQFGWNVGALGGGDISITAGGSILTLSSAVADSYAIPTGSSAPVHFASGGLAATAGGDIGSNQFFLANGSSLLRAGGAFSAVLPITNPNTGEVTTIGSLIAMDDAQMVLEARNGIVLEAVVNPTAIAQIGANSNQASYFYTYGTGSELVVQSTSGSVALLGNSTAQTALMGSLAASSILNNQVYPGSLIARALQQDLAVPNTVLFPSEQGQAELVAGRDISGGGALVMSDAGAGDIPTAQSPSGGNPNYGNIQTEAFSSGRHAGDGTPALIVAGRDALNLVLDLPKAADLIAGRDVTNLTLFGQNLNAADLTLVSAGRDIVASTPGANIQIGGPGRVDVLAARNIDLGLSFGITTVGNSVNPNLPTAAGADLTVIAGLGPSPDYTDFLTKIVAPTAANRTALTNYVEGVSGQSGLSYSGALAEFNSFTNELRRPFLDQIFFSELLDSGREANTVPGAGFARGYAAIDALFPNSRTAAATAASPYVGNLSLDFSRIYTTNGGNISIIVPGGDLDVGLANAPASVPARAASQLGIVAEGTGDVNIYSRSDVNVNSSRIFTLGGGNILIWSDEGSIDAGRGSKSSVSAPPPDVLVDSSGNVTLSFSGAVAGSGIRTIQVDPGVPAGNVDLIAPQGTVNAGDAGIGAAGNINIAAQQVLGLTNISFGGTSTGVPAQVSSIGLSLSQASNTASSASNQSNAAENANAQKEAAEAPLAQAGLSWLEVFVTGLGEENCATSDTDCLKRQKAGEH